MRGKTAIKRAHVSLKARKRTSEASFAKPSRRPTLTDIHKKRRSKERRLLILVEPSITKANTIISLETCYLQINRNWFAVIGNLQNTR